jgi:glycosyltransferase involved in cell wall biosynthesis
MKKTVLYIIDSLGLGGAEMLVVSQIPEVRKRFNVVLVTLSPVNEFEPGAVEYDAYYCLHMNGKRDLIKAVSSLRKIIRAHDVSIVNSVLYWSVIVARLACNRNVHHISNLAITVSNGSYNLKWYSVFAKWLDKLSYKKSEVVVGASAEVLKDFDKELGIKGKSKLLYNFINDQFYSSAINYTPPDSELKLVAVGNLREQKNYQYLVDAFSMMKGENVSIDIYGQGHLKEMLQEQINDQCLSINLKGAHHHIYKVLPQYDGYVMCSEFEGFGIAVAEAMAVGLPVFLSDIPVLREVTKNNAVFFDPAKPDEFVSLVRSALAGRIDLMKMSVEGKRIASSYTRAAYIKGLFDLYDELLSSSRIHQFKFKPVLN